MSTVLFWNCSHGLVAKLNIIEYYIETVKPVAYPKLK